MKFRFVPVLLVCVLLSISAAGQLTGKNRWVNVKSKNFNIIGDASEKDLRDVATKLEQFRETFRVLLKNMNLTSTTETNVVVFRSSSSFRPFKPKRPDGKPDEWIAGYFQPGEARNYITLSTEGEAADVYGTIYHEYIHFLMDTNIGRSTLPAWFNEGIAEYYQTLRIADGQKVYLGELQHGHLELLRSSKLIPFKDFLTAANTTSAGGHSRSVFYAQAWLFMHFLMHGNNGAYSDPLNKFVTLLRREVDEKEAFRQAFGVEESVLEQELQKYLRQRSMMISLYTHDKKLEFDSEMIAVPLTEGEVNMYLGDLLYHSRDYPTAEKYLARAIELEPASAFAQTSLGLVRMRQRKFDEAKKLLESAVAAEGSNYYAHYNYAYVLSRESMDEFGYVRTFPEADLKKMQTALKRSIELKPDFAESYSLLAFVNTVSGQDLPETTQILVTAMKVKPGNQYYAIQLARLLMRQQRFDDALKLAERIARNASKPEYKSNAEQIISTIRQMEAANKFNEEQRVAIQRSGAPRQTLVDRETISPEEAERLETEREIRNLNRLVESPKEGEVQIVGRIKSVSCSAGNVRFEIASDAGTMVLSSKDFQSLNFQILQTGTTNFEIGCNAKLESQLMVANYRAAADAKLRTAGVLTAVSFVPEFFRTMSAKELAEPAQIVIGGPATDVVANEKKIVEEMNELQAKRREAFEKEQRQSILDRINAQLRKPLAGEVRGTGALEKIECTNKAQFALVKIDGMQLKLRLPKEPGAFKLMAFVRDIGSAFGCGTSLPDIKAIITYAPDGKPKGNVAGEIRSLELVPPSFELQ